MENLATLDQGCRAKMALARLPEEDFLPREISTEGIALVREVIDFLAGCTACTSTTCIYGTAGDLTASLYKARQDGDCFFHSIGVSRMRFMRLTFAIRNSEIVPGITVQQLILWDYGHDINTKAGYAAMLRRSTHVGHSIGIIAAQLTGRSIKVFGRLKNNTAVLRIVWPCYYRTREGTPDEPINLLHGHASDSPPYYVNGGGIAQQESMEGTHRLGNHYDRLLIGGPTPTNKSWILQTELPRQPTLEDQQPSLSCLENWKGSPGLQPAPNQLMDSHATTGTTPHLTLSDGLPPMQEMAPNRPMESPAIVCATPLPPPSDDPTPMQDPSDNAPPCAEWPADDVTVLTTMMTTLTLHPFQGRKDIPPPDLGCDSCTPQELHYSGREQGCPRSDQNPTSGLLPPPMDLTVVIQGAAPPPTESAQGPRGHL